ncbi:MspA family porin [Nocardia stercoris]|uniref:MspA family protein n=1 Tax=Nocardia stercoris TaxID=2483361 RepID=A0A3M2L262_9NOCA|nr:MspA family porin [Nocardia stercoris]RMI31792.1 hypothetical protein EBN03_16525 [Nocardia stercoris]
MFIQTVTAAVAALGIGLGSAGPAPLAPHEKVVTTPDGTSVTAGLTDDAVRPVAPLDFMPTTREAYLDNTSYGRIDRGNGSLHSGFFLACAVDLNVSVRLGANAGLSADLMAGAAPGIIPTLGATFGVDLSMQPGKVVDLKLPPEISDKALTAGSTDYIATRDYRLTVQGCAGPLTVQAYTVVLAESPQANIAQYVLGDPTTM